MYCKIRRLELLRTGQGSDCKLRVRYIDKCQKRCFRQFLCHQIMLASASEEFARLISDPDFNRNKQVIYVDDASPDAYESLLLYIYTYEIYNDIKFEMCKDVIYLAKKYKMSDLVNCFIEKFANQNWPVTFLLQIFQLARQYNSPTIMNLVGKKIEPLANKLLNDNCYLKLNIKELNALMVVLKSLGTVSDHTLLLALKRYQIVNDVNYRNMTSFQQFVEVTQLFDNVLFEADGTLAVDEIDSVIIEDDRQSNLPPPEPEPSSEEKTEVTNKGNKKRSDRSCVIPKIRWNRSGK